MNGLGTGAVEATASAAETVVVALAMTGDNGAFEELVRRRQGTLRGLLRRLCGDAALADDLAQEAFIQAWRKLATLKSPAAFGGWLRQIAMNTWLQYLRRANIQTVPLEDLETLPASGETDASSGLDLQRALQRLNPTQRLCVVLCYSEGMSHSEIAVAIGMPLGTVKSHIMRGATRLREYLDAYAEVSS